MVIFPQESARINRVLLNPMQTHTITGTQKNGKSGSIGTLRLFTKYVLSLNNETLVKNFVKEVPHSKKIGYAGFTEKEHLRDNLGYNIPDFENADAKHQAFSISEPELLHTIEESLRLCHKNVSTSPTNIFLFPTFSTFVKEKWVASRAILLTKILYSCIFHRREQSDGKKRLPKQSAMSSCTR